MSRKTLVTLSASMLLGAAIAAPTAALAQFGPPPGPPPMLGGPLQASVPVVLLPVWAPAALLSVVLRRDLSLAFRRVAAPAHPPRAIAGGPPRLDGAGGLRGLERGGQANFRGIEGRAAAYRANGYSRNNYATYGSGRGYRHAYTAAATAAYAYGRAASSSDDDCYYVSAYRRYGTRRVLVCHEA